MNDDSPLRDRVGCVSACRACRSKSDPYAVSLEKKQEWNRKHLQLWEPQLESAQASARSVRYRDRVLLHVEETSEGYRFGLLQDESVLEIPDCPLHESRQNRSLAWLRTVLPRGLPIRFVFSNRDLLTLVVKSKPVELDRELFRPLLDELPQTHWRGVTIDFNAAAGRRVFSAKQRVLLAGQNESQVSWKSRSMGYGPVTFLQNDFELYERAIDRADSFLDPSAALLDLYCGMGMSTAVLSRTRPTVLGIEVAGESLQHARRNVPGAQFLQGTVEDRLPQIEEFVRSQSRVVAFVNPSRLGLGESVIQGISRLSRAPEKIAYLSCSPRSLAEDLRDFEKLGFSVQSITPYDFFPRTGHIENLALITRNTG